MIKRTLSIILLFTLTYISMIFLENISSIPRGAFIIGNPWEIVQIDGTKHHYLDNTFHLELRDIDGFGPGLYILRSNFYLPTTYVNQFLIIPQQPQQGYLVTLDGRFLGKIGDLEEGKGNIWNDSGVFHIHDPITPGFHELEFLIYIDEVVDLHISPYITDLKQNTFRYYFNIVFKKYLGSFMMGITFILSLIFFSSGFANYGNRVNDFLLGLSFVFWSIYLLDYIPIEYTFVSFLNFKKIIITSFTWGVMTTFLIIYRSFYNLNSWKTILKFTLYSCFISFLIMLSKSIINLNYHMIITFILCFLPAIKVFKPEIVSSKRFTVNYVVVGLIIGISFVTRFIYFKITHKPHVILFHIGFFISLVFICLYFVSNYINTIKKVTLETKRADHYFKKSVIDSLTGANNREVLEYINLTKFSFTLFICDLDNFKTINDNYGHVAGDSVLLSLTTIIKKSIRDSDFVIRYGGDEFIIILIDCSYEISNRIITNIWSDIELAKIDIPTGDFSYSCSGGGVISENSETFDMAFKRADKVLYHIKDTNKGRFKLIK